MKSFLLRNKAIIAVVILLGLFVWKLPLQTQDGPNHKKVALVIERLDNSPVESQIYLGQLSFYRTNGLFPLLYNYSAKLWNIHVYEKVFWGIFIILIPIAYRYFLSVWSPASVSLWILSLPFCFFSLYVRGFYNFLAAVPLTLIALALMRRGFEKASWIHYCWFLLVSWFAFLAHPFPFLILPIALGLMWLLQFRKKWLQLLAYGLPIALMFVLGFIVPMLIAQDASSGAVYNFKSLPELLGGMFVFNFAAYAEWQIFFYVPFVALLIALMVISIRKVPWTYKAYWMALLVVYLLFPAEGRGGSHLSERFLLFVWFFVPLGLELGKGMMRAVQVIVLVCFVTAGSFLYSGMQDVDAKVQEARNLYQELPVASRLYPINFDLHGPSLNYSSLMHLWANYDDKAVALSPYLFAHMELMPLSRIAPATTTYFPATREDHPERIAQNSICKGRDILETTSCQEIREKAYKDIIANASFYDYWFVNEAPEEFLQILNITPGLKQVAGSNNMSLWQFSRAKNFDPELP